MCQACRWRCLLFSTFAIHVAMPQNMRCGPNRQLEHMPAKACKMDLCCKDVIDTGPSWIRTLSERVGHRGSLLTQLALALPVAESLGNMTSINSYPVTPAFVMSSGKDPILLKMAIHVGRISSINEKAQQFDMKYSISWAWHDCRVMFNCSMLSLDQNHELFNKFWRPPLKILQLEDERDTMRYFSHQMSGHGWHTFTQSHAGTFRCSFDFTDMPYDTQTCKLTFLLPGVPKEEINLEWEDVISEKLDNSQWIIDQGSDWQRSKMETKQAMHHGRFVSLSTLEASFKLTRKPNFLAQSYILQAMLFYTLSYVGLFIDNAAVPARAAAGIIPVLVMSNKMNSLSSAIPPISYPTRLSRFLFLTLVMISLHMVEFGLVHFAFSRIKLYKEKTPVLEDGMDIVVRSRSERWMQRWVSFHVTYTDMSMRIASPLIYLLCTAFTLGTS
eukprot:TRINITY_DN13201_c0_g1_i1.p1 TRINITY_DN13201_c0_g1~~TRINITY_DN13201_c0_g1_i1.p1  ORF type:complete len:443 (-),score=32.79 TRINITY_DN13201_c0_g1_i1:746-2074(-)